MILMAAKAMCHISPFLELEPETFVVLFSFVVGVCGRHYRAAGQRVHGPQGRLRCNHTLPIGATLYSQFHISLPY